MTQLIPLGNNVLVEPNEKQTQTKSGILLADNRGDDAPQMGTVISVSEDVETVKAGDGVLFKKYSPDEVEVDLKKFLIVNIDDILAIIKND